MLMTFIYGLMIILGIVSLDQLTKVMSLALLKTENNSLEIIKGFFRLELKLNDGAAFSSFSGKFYLLMAITVVATIIFIAMALKANFKKAPWYSVGIFFMIGGMLGNLIDRIFRPNHAVVDMLSFTFFGSDFAVFNVADSFLVVGVILLLIDVIFFEGKRTKVVKNNA